MDKEKKGGWLSTKRPPKQQLKSKLPSCKGPLSRKQLPIQMLSSHSGSSTFSRFTQNSPPPPQLRTNRKQSSLTDYFCSYNQHHGGSKSDLSPQPKTRNFVQLNSGDTPTHNQHILKPGLDSALDTTILSTLKPISQEDSQYLCEGQENETPCSVETHRETDGSPSKSQNVSEVSDLSPAKASPLRESQVYNGQFLSLDISSYEEISGTRQGSQLDETPHTRDNKGSPSQSLDSVTLSRYSTNTKRRKLMISLDKTCVSSGNNKSVSQWLKVPSGLTNSQNSRKNFHSHSLGNEPRSGALVPLDNEISIPDSVEPQTESLSDTHNQNEVMDTFELESESSQSWGMDENVLKIKKSSRLDSIKLPNEESHHRQRIVDGKSFSLTSADTQPSLIYESNRPFSLTSANTHPPSVCESQSLTFSEDEDTLKASQGTVPSSCVTVDSYSEYPHHELLKAQYMAKLGTLAFTQTQDLEF